jgi:hypothetical protein
MFHILTLKGKKFSGNYAMQKSKFKFLHGIGADFRDPLKSFDGGLPKKKIEEKKMFFCENSVEIRRFDGTHLNFDCKYRC